MNIDVQSCSIDVPGGCPNKCKCCVSELHKNKKFMNNVLGNCNEITNDDRNFIQYRDRLAYVREKTDTAVLTGTASEPVFNKPFLRFFSRVNRSLPAPFYNIEVQSAGIGMDNNTLNLLQDVGVKTVALSLFSLDSVKNNEIQQSPKSLYYIIEDVCARIHENGFNLRLCFNLNKEGFGNAHPVEMIREMMVFAQKVGADQVTFRKLYHNGDDSFDETVWVKANQLDDVFYDMLTHYIKQEGHYKRTLSFGADLYTINGISTIVDSDCMAKEIHKSLKYLIIRRNIKIYSDWDDEGSLIF